MFNLFKTKSEKAIESGNTDDLGQIADFIISQSQMDKLTPDDLKAVKDGIIMQLNRRLGLIIMDNLSKKALEEYTNLLGTSLIPDPKKLETFLVKNIPDYQEKIKIGLDEFVDQAIRSFSK